MSKRASRKQDHINHFMEQQVPDKDYFAGYHLAHNALPEIDFDAIDLSTTFLGKKVLAPIMINAITGGIEEVHAINKSLATLAKEAGIPMAVGSQSIAIKKQGDSKSFTLVREIMGQEGVVIGNMSANVSVEHAKAAVELLQADGLQLHLNVAQEIVMPEGDRSFKGVLKNIETIANKLSVPVIIKEVGNGISGDVAKRLMDIGVQYIDVGGKGGTNFIQIEDGRNKDISFKELYDWGIPTPLCLEQCAEVATGKSLTLIASGGIERADQVIKSLCLGADMVGMSGIFLRQLLLHGQEDTGRLLGDIMYKLKVYMLLLGAHNIQGLKKKGIISKY